MALKLKPTKTKTFEGATLQSAMFYCDITATRYCDKPRHKPDKHDIGRT